MPGNCYHLNKEHPKWNFKRSPTSDILSARSQLLQKDPKAFKPALFLGSWITANASADWSDATCLVLIFSNKAALVPHAGSDYGESHRWIKTKTRQTKEPNSAWSSVLSDQQECISRAKGARQSISQGVGTEYPGIGDEAWLTKLHNSSPRVLSHSPAVWHVVNRRRPPFCTELDPGCACMQCELRGLLSLPVHSKK